MLLIVAIAAVVLVKILAGTAPGGADFTLDVFKVAPGTGNSALFLGIIFGLLSFAGFEAAATLGEEATNPSRDIPRAILGTAIFGGIYFTVVTAIEMMAFGTDADGVAAFGASESLLGDIGTTYLGSWVGDAVTLGAAISAFGCCLACMVGASRLLFALARDASGDNGLGRTSAAGTPANAAVVVAALMALIIVVTIFFGAEPFDTFLWSATIGTLLLLVIYVLTTIGAIRLVFVQKKMSVPAWQVIIPIAALVVLGYTIYRNVIPYPTEGAARWFPIVAGVWLLLAIIVVVAAPGLARRIGANLTSAEGFVPDEPRGAETSVHRPGTGVRG